MSYCFTACAISSPFRTGPLGLRTVLADDAEVVAARLAVPAFGVLHVVRAELAEAVRAEEHLVGRIVRDDHLGPVDHRGRHEMELVRTEVEHVALLHHLARRRHGGTEELLHELERLDGGDDRRGRILREEAVDVRRVVRLHVLHHEVVGRAAGERRLDVGEPGVAEALIHRVHHGDLPVDDHVAVVGHAARDDVLSLEEVDVVVVHADVLDVVADCHIAVCSF